MSSSFHGIETGSPSTTNALLRTNEIPPRDSFVEETKKLRINVYRLNGNGANGREETFSVR